MVSDLLEAEDSGGVRYVKSYTKDYCNLCGIRLLDGIHACLSQGVDACIDLCPSCVREMAGTLPVDKR